MHRIGCLTCLLAIACAKSTTPTAAPAMTEPTPVQAVVEQPLFSQSWWLQQPVVDPGEAAHYAGTYLTPSLLLDVPPDWEVLADVDVEEQGLPLTGGRLLHALPQTDASRGAMDSGILVDLILPARAPTSRSEVAGLVRWWLDRATRDLGTPWTQFLVDDAGPWELTPYGWPEPFVLAALEIPDRPTTWVVAFPEGEMVYVAYAFVEVHPTSTRALLRNMSLVETSR